MISVLSNLYIANPRVLERKRALGCLRIYSISHMSSLTAKLTISVKIPLTTEPSLSEKNVVSAWQTHRNQRTEKMTCRVAWYVTSKESGGRRRKNEMIYIDEVSSNLSQTSFLFLPHKMIPFNFYLSSLSFFFFSCKSFIRLLWQMEQFIYFERIKLLNYIVL